MSHDAGRHSVFYARSRSGRQQSCAARLPSPSRRRWAGNRFPIGLHLGFSGDRCHAPRGGAWLPARHMLAERHDGPARQVLSGPPSGAV